MFRFLTFWLEPLACFIYLLAVVFHYRSKRQAPNLALSGYYLIATILLALSCIRSVMKIGQTIWLYDLVSLFMSVCLGAYFYKVLQTKGKRRVVVVLTAAYVLYALLRNLTMQGPRLFDSIGYSLVSASVVVYVFMYFHQVLKNVTEASIFGEFNFWLSSGYLVYYLGSFIIFLTYFYFTKKLFENYSEDGKQLLMALWGLHNVLLFVGASSLLIGSLWIAYRKKST